MSYSKVSYITGGSTWQVPANWNSLDNKVECVGAGGDGVTYWNSGASLYLAESGGGGAYAASTNVTLTPGATININVGTLKDTCFNGTSLGGCTVGAQKGSSGVSGGSAGVGGAASSSVGTTKYSGGNGGSGGGSHGFAAGGGGSAGPNGAGGNGATALFPEDFQIASGGTADGGTVSAGSSGSEFGGGYGCGGGGRGAYTGSSNGANYGGGGGSQCAFHTIEAADGAGGLIIVSYNPNTDQDFQIWG